MPQRDGRGAREPAGADVSSGTTVRLETHSAAESSTQGGATQRVEGEKQQSSGTLLNLPSALARDYEIIRPLPTKGGEADILVVRSRETREERIAKLYRFQIKPKGEVLEQLLRADPNFIIRLFGYGESDGVWYELQEYAPGGSLADLLEARGKLEPEEVRAVLVQVREALVYLHGLEPRIVHRDLKPSNILLRKRDPLEVVLADFGLAANLDFSTRMTKAHRTILYAPPEAAQIGASGGASEPQQGEVSPQFDWWSLGVTVAELLVGRRDLLAGRSEAIIEADVRQGSPFDLQALWARPGLRKPLDWARLCRGLLQLDRKERWGASKIAVWLKGEAVPLPPASEEWLRTGEWQVEQRAAKPYQLGEQQCATAAELAAAMRAHWELASRDIARMSALDGWLTRELGNHNASRWLHDLNEEPRFRSLDPTGKLSLFLPELDPALPPIIGGRELTEQGFKDLARAASAGGTAAWPTVLRPQFGELLAERTKASWLVAAYAAWGAAARKASKLDDEMQRLAPQLPTLAPEGNLALLNFAIDREARMRFFDRNRKGLNSREVKACRWTAPALPADPESAAHLWLWSQRLARASAEGRALLREAEREGIARRKRLLKWGGIAAVACIVVGPWLYHRNQCAAQRSERDERRQQQSAMEDQLASYVGARKAEQGINAQACAYAHHLVFALLNLDQNRANMAAILNNEALPYKVSAADEIAAVEARMRNEETRARSGQAGVWYELWATSPARFAGLPNAGQQCASLPRIDLDALQAEVVNAAMPAARYADVTGCGE